MRSGTLAACTLLPLLLLTLACGSDPASAGADDLGSSPTEDVIEDASTPDPDTSSTEDAADVEDMEDAAADLPPDLAPDLPPDPDPEPDLPMGSWAGVNIASVKAPDEQSVVLTFDMPPPVHEAEDAGIYHLMWAGEELPIDSVEYDALARKATIITAREQALGVTYRLEVAPQGLDEPLVAEILAAERATFWVSDFSDPFGGDLPLNTKRVVVGERCVVYVEVGETLDKAQALADEFDANIYPVLTELLIEPPDIDGNGRVIILGLNGQGHFGGYFSPINQYPESYTMENFGMHSNEGEIIHLNTWMWGTPLAPVAAHEFQHLLYHERHGFTQPYWQYHDEGMAESAVHAVYGVNQTGVDYLMWDPEGAIGAGLSLINWTYAAYENYTVAYLFWVYVAAQITGDAEGFALAFNLPTGSPNEVDGLLQEHLDLDMATVHHFSLVSLWLQQASGFFGFNGMLNLIPGQVPTVPAGTSSLNLQPYAGAWFKLNVDELVYPQDVGPNIRYISVDDQGAVYLDEPFKVNGGVLVAYNRNKNYGGYPSEPSGPGVAASRGPTRDISPVRPPATWLDPPVFHPSRPTAWRRWFEAREAREALVGF